MRKIKNITIWHKGYFAKFTVMLLIFSFILLAASCKQDSGLNEAEYPPPQNLHIAGFSGSGEDRVVNLAWEAPDTGLTITRYAMYRNGEEVTRTTGTEYNDSIGNSDYDFYVTAIYEDGTESGPGNTINTGNPADMSPVGPGDTVKDQENDEDSGLNGDDDKDSDPLAFNWDEILSSPCGNPYYPVVEGISYTYSSSNGTYASTITDVRDAGFTVTYSIADSTQTHEWECLPEGLVDFSNPLGDALKVMGEGATIVGNTSVSGITIPSAISVGDTWSQTYSGTLEVQEYDGALDFSATTNYSAVSKEEVTVSIGTFEALKVNSTLEADFILKTHGMSMPLYTYNMTGTTWFVENIGPVKSASQGLIKGIGQMSEFSQDFSDTTELIEFSLPQ